jgi:di/tricarboxylate transporter
LRADRNFLLLDRVVEPPVRRHKAPVALVIMAAVVGLAAVNVMPVVLAAIVGCIALVLARCLTLDEAYAAVDWRVIVLLAGVLPLGTALDQTGAARWLAETGMRWVGGFGPVAALAVVYVLTLTLTEMMSNTATAAVMCPIAISAAASLGVSPKPFLMAVTFAASVNFATPVGYQTNLMVLNPGGYKFRDFLRVGVPLDLLFCVLAIYFIPRFWPF